MKKNLLIIFTSLFVLSYYCRVNAKEHSHPQHPENIEASDTTFQETPEFYKNMKEASDKHRLTKKLYDFLVQESPAVSAVDQNKPIDEGYQPYKGKIIRDIQIFVLDPFGTSIYTPDSTKKDEGLNKIANSLHKTTREFIIRNNLQFKVGDSLDPLVVAETEAFIRNEDYIHDVRILVDSIPLSDQVNVVVVVRDVFSVGVNVHSLSLSHINTEIFDKNFLGLGSRANVNVVYRSKYEQKLGFGLGYKYKNISHTFIDMNGSYLDDIQSQNFDISVERPLLTTFRYFGQASYDWYHYRTQVAGWDSVSPDHNQTMSLSFGRAFTLKNDKATKRLVLSARYLEQQPEYVDVTPVFTQYPYQYVRRKMFLTQLSLYQQAYYREYMIHNFGVTENIAYGYNISGQLGYNDFIRSAKGMYTSLSASAGQQFDPGNIYLSTAISTYFNRKQVYEGVLMAEMKYFSPLMKLHRNRFRQFFNVNYTKMLNPSPVVDNVLYYSSLSSLNTSNYSDMVTGTERLMFNAESDLFSRINLIGFRFLFYAFGDIGWISPGNNLLKQDNLYGGFGLGIRIRNDILLFKTIDIRLGYYPRLDQKTINDYIDFSSSDVMSSPNFVPSYPNEILIR